MDLTLIHSESFCFLMTSSFLSCFLRVLDVSFLFSYGSCSFVAFSAGFHSNKLFLLSFIKSFTCGESLNFWPCGLTVLTGTAFEVA